MKTDELKIREAAIKERLTKIAKTNNIMPNGIAVEMFDQMVDFFETQKKIAELLCSDGTIIHAYKVAVLAYFDFLIAAYDEIINGVNAYNKKKEGK